MQKKNGLYRKLIQKAAIKKGGDSASERGEKGEKKGKQKDVSNRTNSESRTGNGGPGQWYNE